MTHQTTDQVINYSQTFESNHSTYAFKLLAHILIYTFNTKALL